MELFLTLVIWGLMTFGIYKWSEHLGRNSAMWALICIVSPLISAVCLLFAGKTLEKQAEDAMAIKEMMERK